jgi:putative ABC transport system permease protein
MIEGFRYSVSEQFQDIGTNLLIINSYKPQGLKGKLLKEVKLTIEDAKILKDKIPNIYLLSPLIKQGMIATYKDQSYTTIVNGTDFNYPTINSHYVKEGRFISKIDMLKKNPVCVVGVEVIKNLKIAEPYIGQVITLNGQVLSITGILEKKGYIFGQNIDDQIIIPIDIMKTIAAKKNIDRITITSLARKSVELDLVEHQISSCLRRIHNLDNDTPDDFKIIKQTELIKTFNKVFDNLTLIFGGIVGISLLVGGVGIMNIMFSSIQERKKEIGICMAVGATKTNILLQFLFEAVAICSLGGIFGILSGIVISKLFLVFPNFPDPYTPMWVIFSSFLFSNAVGLIFGIVPAIRASRLDPIEIIKYE